MAVDYKAVLQYCHTWLLDNLIKSDVKNIIDYLIQKGIVQDDYIETVTAEITTKDQIRELLKLIKKKEIICYETFFYAIEQAGLNHVSHRLKIAEAIFSIKTALKHLYESKTDEVIPHTDIISSLTGHLSEHSVTVGKDIVVFKEALAEAFMRANVENMDGKEVVKHIAMKKLGKAAVDSQRTENNGSAATDLRPFDSAKKIEDWDVEEVAKWLAEEKLPDRVIQDFKDQEIDGLALINLTEEHLKSDEMPNIKIGPRLRIISKISMLKQEADNLMTRNVTMKEAGSKLIPIEHKNKGTIDKHMIRDSHCDLKPSVSKIVIDPPSELENKLISLLSLDTGNATDLYPILVTTKMPDEMKDTIKEKFSFVGEIPWKAVFDFDCEGTLLKYLEDDAEKVMKVVPCISDFHKSSPENMKNPDRLTSLQEEIIRSVQRHWIFANGYSTSDEFPPLNPVQWIKQKREAFKEAVRFFDDQIPKNRAIIVFLLLSSETEVVQEAMQEFLSAFQSQWVLISQDAEEIAEPVFSELIRRNCVEDRGELEARSVIGMSWAHIQETVERVFSPPKVCASRIPCSTGALIPLKQKVKNELADLEILSASECDDSELANNQDSCKAFALEEERRFYSGGEVSWWNFWMEDHVLKRNKHREILGNVKDAINGNFLEDSFIGKVCIYHHPGAGGTTAAKQILWENRKVYRCAIVRNITDQTTSQIKRFRAYEDNEPGPVLLLIDNLDEEPVELLLAKLEETAKHEARSGTSSKSCKQPFCVFLICFRRPNMPGNDYQSFRTLIYQELDANEISWFECKNTELENRHDDLIQAGFAAINPKMLISFNIMRENFDEEYIQRITREMINEITDEKERKLLKYIAMLNAFDLKLRKIPCAAFDTMMVPMPWQPGPRYGKRARFTCWETRLSSMFKVLINESSAMTFQSIKTFRITSPLLSKHVLKEVNDAGETISDMALAFLKYREIFSVSSHAKNELLRIIRDLMKQRARLPSGKPETTFSPILQHIIDNECTKNAMYVLELVFELTKDPFIAQQLARINIYDEKWKQAEQYAEQATKIVPDNSYLWDTYGRVYKSMVGEVYKSIVASPDKKLDLTETLNVINYATRGADIFRNVQSLSERDKRGLSNNAGYFGELDISECLLHCLNNASCFHNKFELKKCMLSEDYYPEELRQLLDTKDGKAIRKLKDISRNTEKAVIKLDDEKMQLREATVDEYRSNSFVQESIRIEEILANLDVYLGEDSDDLPPDVAANSDEACRHRRRRIKSLGANSLRQIFELRKEIEGEKKMARINQLSVENISSGRAVAIDYQMAIAVSLAYAATGPRLFSFSRKRNITFNDFVAWSQRLYELRDTGNGIIYLEPYLFFLLFNWPRERRKSSVSVKTLTQAQQNWKAAYYKKWPTQTDGAKPYRKKDTTTFFLSNGADLGSFVNYHELKGPEYQKRGAALGDAFWRQPQIIGKLERFHGILSRYGESVEIKIGADKLNIPTSFPIRDRNMWNKQVFFVIGFSWLGPKAFDISLTKPVLQVHTLQRYKSMSKQEDHETRKLEPLQMLTHDQVQHALYSIDEQLREIESLKQEMKKSRKLSKAKLDKLKKEDQLKHQRAYVWGQRQKLLKRHTEY